MVSVWALPTCPPTPPALLAPGRTVTITARVRPDRVGSYPNKVVVRLKISGFYDLIQPGETGNKAGILPSADASSIKASTPNE